MARDRRGRGEHSVYQRESDGRWVATVSLGVDGRGKRRRKVLYAATKAEALRKLKAFDPDKQVDPRGWTLGRLIDHWLEHSAPRTAREHVVERYRFSIDSHVRPHLGHMRLKDISPVTIEQFYSLLSTIPSKRGGVISKRTQQIAASRLFVLLKHAVKLRLIAWNPAEDFRKPAAPRPELPIWNPEQARVFLQTCRGHKQEALFVMALSTGMRQGELFGLEWADVDFENGTVAVRRSVLEFKGKLSTKVPKNGKSRVVQLPQVALEALHQHRKRALAAGTVHYPIFHARNGAWLRRCNLLRGVFEPLIAKAGVPKIRFHDLRHCHATFLLEAGVDPKTISERLGHSDVKVTLSTYSTVLPSMQRRAAEQMDRLYGPHHRLHGGPGDAKAESAS